MTIITTSEKTGSYALTIAFQYKRKLPTHARIVPNRKLFHKQFPHVIELSERTVDSYKNYQDARSDLHQIAAKLKTKLNVGDENVVKTRIEGYTLRIYTKDLTTTLDKMRPAWRRMIKLIECMEPHVENHIVKAPKDTYRTLDRVVRKLPYGDQKFKIYYANRSSVKQAIGPESLAGILFQLQQYNSVRWTRGLADSITDKYGNWHENFFYSTDLDWLPLVTLIDGRFIKRIERLTVESEIESV